MQKVLAIVGPTAVGKSAIGIEIAKRLNGEIISGDSVQIYRGFNIGSAKIKEEEMDGIVHHLIDIKDPKDRYSVKEFQKLARLKIEEIINRGKLPIIVGGTGLYIKACLYDYVFQDEEEEDNPFDDLSNEELYNRLLEVDPKCLEKIHVNNRKRLVRAYNVVLKHGKMSEFIDSQEHKMIYDALIVGLTMEKELLYKRCDERVLKMVEEGLIAEVESLIKGGSSFDDQAMQAIGYKEWQAYFDKKASLKEVITKIQLNTRHFVKRQYTWFNRQTPIIWKDNHDFNGILKEVELWLKN